MGFKPISALGIYAGTEMIFFQPGFPVSVVQNVHMCFFFFPPFLITFSDGKDVADGHQTVQNVNYDWVESEHIKKKKLFGCIFFLKDHSTYGTLKRCLVFIKAK